MDSPRFLLWVSLAAVLYLMYEAWQADYAPPPLAPIAATVPDAGLPSTPPPAAAPPSLGPSTAPAAPVSAAPPVTATAVAATGQRVSVRTDLMDIDLDTLGADLVRVDLLDYPVKKGGAEAVRLMDAVGEARRIAQTGLRAGAEGAAPDHRTLWRAAQDQHVLAEGQDRLEVAFNWERGDGLTVEKVYTFHRGDYLIDVEFRVKNASAQAFHADAYLQLVEHLVPIERSLFSAEGYSYSGPAFHDGAKYEKLPVDELAERPLERKLAGGWIAVLQHYFVAALLPRGGEGENAYFAKSLGGTDYVAGVVMPARAIAAGTNGAFAAQFWIGPKLQDRLESVAPGLELSVDYGMLTIFAQPLFWLLEKLHSFVGNWGWAIVLLTLIVKLVFYKLAETSGRSMAKMRKVAPKLEQLKERYRDDRQKLNEAMIELYRKEKINPVSGCLPILIQLPVFIALYWVLLESVELRQAPWILWIGDMSAKDPYFVLPLLMGIAMWAQMKLNPPPPDPVQAKVMMFMPILFTGMSAFFPAGLTLYWLINTALSVLQQWQINRVVDAEGWAK
jgi:YidC/Oxa1 family membrane protein insertase